MTPLTEASKNANAKGERSTVAGTTLSAKTVADKALQGNSPSVTTMMEAPSSQTLASAITSVQSKGDEKSNGASANTEKPQKTTFDWQLFNFVPFKCKLFYPPNFKMYMPMNSHSSLSFRVDQKGDLKKEELILDCAICKGKSAFDRAHLVAEGEKSYIEEQGFAAKLGPFTSVDGNRVFFSISYEGHGFKGIARYMVLHEEGISYTLKCQTPKDSNTDMFRKFFECFSVNNKRYFLAEITVASLG